MYLTSAIAVVSLAGVAQAHVAMWNKGMFGYNYPNQAGDATQNYNTNEPVTPLRESDALSVDQWFGHGYKSFPPIAGDFMDLPSGGTYMGELACNRADSKMRDPIRTDPQIQYACGGEGALHTVNKFNGTVDNKWFGGTAIGIAYTSDVNALQPNDLTIISVNQASPWFRETAYQIPAGLPPCPEGGCLCSWNWLHRANNGEGYPFEMYNLLYRCQVTGNTNPSNVVQRGAVAKDCTGNPSACVKGPKTGLYIYQRSGNNLPHLDIPPSYTNDWGFSDGAQNDIFTAASAPAGTTYQVNPYATPTATGGASVPDPTPTATALPSGWKTVGCTSDQPRFLSDNIYVSDDNTISKCIGQCNDRGYQWGSVQYGKECWCGNTTATPIMVNDDECDVRCPGDIWAKCGGSWKANLFKKDVPAAVTSTSSVVVSSTTASSSSSSSSSSLSTTSSTTSSASGTSSSSTTTLTTSSTTSSSTTLATSSTTSSSTTIATSSTTSSSTASRSSTTATSPTATSSTATVTSTTTSSATTSAASPSSTIPAGWNYIGCHKELDGGLRSLNGSFISQVNNTAATCIAFCSARGYSYAGTQWSAQCFCGNTFTPRNVSQSECSSTCIADKNQFCGGGNRNSVYVTDAILAQMNANANATRPSASSSSSTTSTPSSSTTTARSSSSTTSSSTLAATTTTSTTSSTASPTGTASTNPSVVTVTVTQTVTDSACGTNPTSTATRTAGTRRDFIRRRRFHPHAH